MAKILIFTEVSTGAQNDLERSSELARNMVCSYGMSEKLGAITFGKKQTSLFLGTDYNEQKNYSDETARQIDAEVKEIVETSYRRVKELMDKNRAVLDNLAPDLEEKEVLSGEEVDAIMNSSC
jgi:cell division protease FtsH